MNFEVTYYLSSGKEIGTLIEAVNLDKAREAVKEELLNDSIDVADDLVLYSKYVTHFLVQERE
ncbi:hypothetical protein [Priestia megaterium]|uniref:hypothetical protein n=1 Tax=Priestia megaterium TaxID=1404 RepID=UPI000BF40073|nr:hypothetical protein [Priestia megaterium]PFW43767.1 hypothetical protein COL17_26530 [Priestia megaterium]